MSFCSLLLKGKVDHLFLDQIIKHDIQLWLFSHLFKGLENCWERHRRVAEYFHRGLEAMGLKLFVKERVSFKEGWSKMRSTTISKPLHLLQTARLPTVTTIVAPHGYDWKEITTYIMKTHNLEISGGLGPSVGLVGNILSARLFRRSMYSGPAP